MLFIFARFVLNKIIQRYDIETVKWVWYILVNIKTVLLFTSERSMYKSLI